MHRPTDDELLARAARGSREALAQIAQRYLGFVYHAALRQVGDPHLAEDVTQAVFVILSGKIRRVKPGTHLHGWLFTTTRNAARNALKLRARRAHYERQAAIATAAAAKRHAEERVDDPNNDIAPLLDAALADLREADRSAVLMSYFGNKSWREVGEAIGATEEAARKRVERAIERMRQFCVRRAGVAVSATAVVVAMRASASAAPPEALANSIASLMSSCSASAAASAWSVGVIHMMTLAKVKAAAAIAVAFMVTLVGAGAAMMSGAAAPEEKPAPAQTVVQLANDVRVELLGVSKRPSADAAWWHADGTPADAPYRGSNGSDGTIGDNPDDARELVLRVTGPNIDDLGVKIELADRPGWTTGALDGVEGGRLIAFGAKGKPAADVRITLASGPWETLLTQQPTGFRSDMHVVFGPAIEEDGTCTVTTSDDLMDHQARVVAIGVDGQLHESAAHMVGITKGFRQMTTRFDLTKDEIERFEFQARQFDQFVLFKNVSLAPGKDSGFKQESGKVEVKDPKDR
jgi:RNA polymerase sigma factor (sigma-70 family)